MEPIVAGDQSLLAEVARHSPDAYLLVQADGTITWAKIGRFPGKWKSAISYNGFTYILANDGIDSPTYHGGVYARLAADVAGGLLIVSQFTLAADTASGNRPGFSGAAPPEHGRAIYEAVLAEARALHPVVERGEFGADMKVHLLNDGPVTIPLRIA